MSLRGKIVLLFLGLAVLPLLAVAGFGYWQAAQLAEDVVGESLDENARIVADRLDSAALDLEDRLSALAVFEVTQALGSAEWNRERWEYEARANLPQFAFVELRSLGVGRVAAVGSQPDHRIRCTRDVGSRAFPVRKALQVAGVDFELEGWIWPDELLTPEARPQASLLVFNRNTREVLLSTSCGALDAGAPSALTQLTLSRTGGEVQRTKFEVPGEGRQLSAVAALTSRDWDVASFSQLEGVMTPLKRLQASYWLFILMLTIATALAFSLLLDRVVLSLEELTRAADRIGAGELDPWLPPPGDDEVGRLSLAFSGMLDRVRQTMQKVDQSGRLAVVGRLAAYLAHEIRNPLSSIRMNLQSLQRDVKNGRIPGDCGESIDISLKEVDRLARSVTNVLQLGRPSPGPRENVSIHAVLEEAAELLSGEFQRSGVHLEMELDATADQVLAVAGQIKGVLLNLMMNALEAQPGGGRLTISSRLESARGTGPVVAVHLRDWGRGIPPEIRERIFDPFFTTKPQGSGIGLAVALRTLRENGGDLYLADRPESVVGAEFVIEVPLAAVAADRIPDPNISLPPWLDSAHSPPVVREDLAGAKAEAGVEESTATPVSARNGAMDAFMALAKPDTGELH